MSPRLAWILPPLIAACGGGATGSGPPPEAGVQHLDPRLEDGRPSAEVLERAPSIVQRWTVPSGVEDPAVGFAALAPWTFSNSVGRPGQKTTGMLVSAADYRPAEGIIHSSARLAEGVDAEQVNRVEVDLRHLVPGSAVLTWRTKEPIEGLEPGALRAETVSVGAGEETLAFDLSAHPGWRGQVRDLVLYPCWRGNQVYELSEVRFCWSGFAPGAQPSSALGGTDGDAGLLGFSGDLRRTWPTDSGVPLFETVRVPRGGRLVVDVALARRLDDERAGAHFALDVRAAEGSWEERALRSLVPGRDAQGARWRGLVADLADLAGQDVDLRFRSWIGEAGPSSRHGMPGTGGELREGRLWWGNPLLLGEQPADRRPDVLLITLDTLRTDAVGCYGGAQVTPFLDGLAEESLLFEETWSACNSTLPSHTSLLTGQSVPTHGVLDNRSTLAEEVRTLAQSMRAAGYQTAAAVSVEHLQAGWSGLGRGFDQYLDVQLGASVDGGATVERLLEWSEAWAQQGDRPLFVWLHLFDPHTPYGPPRPYLADFTARRLAGGGAIPPTRVDPPTVGTTGYTQPGRFLDGVTNVDFARFLYEASVAYTDELVRDVVLAWQNAGRWEHTLCAITADHGESLGEQGVYYGHQLLHTPVMQVPLILRVPGGPTGRIAARAWSPDLVTTLVDELGLEGLAPSGRNLLELEDDARRVWFVHAGLDQVGCRDGDVHYWHNRREYLQLGRDRAQAAGLDFVYRPVADPGLLSNLSEVEPGLAARYASAMREWMSGAHRGRSVSARLTEEDEQRLDEMGYTGGEE